MIPSSSITVHRAKGLTSILWLPLACGCGSDPVNMPPPQSGDTISFAQHIQPIFNARCISCHQDGTFASGSGIAMRLTADRSFATTVNQPSSQNASLTLVVPGDSATSLLYLKVSQNSPPVGSRMPLLSSPLSSTDLGLIRDWIDQGALNN
jgi:hypothetical protein